MQQTPGPKLIPSSTGRAWHSPRSPGRAETLRREDTKFAACSIALPPSSMRGGEQVEDDDRH